MMAVKRAFETVIRFLLLLNVLVVAVKCEETVETYCPNKGKAANGKWKLDEKDGLRCILDCYTGYIPNGCHILRKDGYGEWNHNITRCEEESWLNKKKLACYTAIAFIILASPWILWALGFSAVGIVAGSLAAKWMASIGIVSAGSLFAWLQSLGTTGIGWPAFLKLIGTAGGACDVLIDFFSETPCEVE